VKKLALIFVTFSFCSVYAELWMPSIFSDSMVIQSRKPAAIWGESDPETEVTVEFADQLKTTRADSAGRWRVWLDPLPVSSRPEALIVRSGESTLEYMDILVGEVWILAGQSNMGWPLSKSDGGSEAAAEADYPWLRIFTQWPYQGAADKPARDVTGGRWITCNPQNASDISGVGFFFARKLRELLGPDTPLALVNTQMGGTYAECWIDMETLKRTSSARPFLDKAAKEITPGESDPKGYWGEDNFRRPSAMYNGKVAPLQPFAARGVVWYQGEGNSQKWLAYGYEQTLTALINSWRDGFKDSLLPFLIVQLPRYNAGPGNDWQAVQAAQAEVADKMQGVEMVVTLDCGRDDEIHPPDKQPVGERLALLASEKVYGPNNNGGAAAKQYLESKYTDIKYGEHQRQSFDLWLARPEDESRPTPLCIYIHGGGFKGGDKSHIQKDVIQRFLDKGVSFVSMNYRLTDGGKYPYPAAMNDCARGVQFIRSQAGQLNIDSSKTACYGGSAGAGISLWLAFKDDMAEPESENPIARQSTRIIAAGALGGQSSYDMRVIRKWFECPDLPPHSAMADFYGIREGETIETPRVAALAEDASPINHLTRDDPPVYMAYNIPNERVTAQTNQGVWVHHPLLGLKLQNAMRRLGIESVVNAPGIEDGRYRDIYDFLIQKLTQ
jgi:acetyl esterase/lipase